MSRRLWYPQLDVYDAVRRIGGLLALWAGDAPPSPERLYIADFYLANPPLLHRTNMPREVRTRFYDLGIQRPDKSFVSYPSAPVLFQKMGEVQRQAFRTLTGKGLIDLDGLKKGNVIPSSTGMKVFKDKFVPLFGDDEKRTAEFIANSFAQNELDITALRRSTGLRRAA